MIPLSLIRNADFCILPYADYIGGSVVLERMLQPRIDLSSCEMEPIHSPGSIQPHGMLIVLSEPELEIIQVSDNTQHFLDLTAEELLGQNVLLVFDEPYFSDFKQTLQAKDLTHNPTYLFDLPCRKNGQGQILNVVAHRMEGVLLLEFEAKGQEAENSSYPELIQTLKSTLTKIRSAPDLQAFWQTSIGEIKRLTGFDRVMVYEFDQEGNGAVIAETREARLESYLDLHYPASDIPQRARQLYLKSMLRIIPDIHYQPAQLVPAHSPETGEALDMTYVAVRGVSPIHIQYLQNMGVSGTMSISIITDNALWGLIACHHYEPKYIPLHIRTLCSLLGQFVSLEYIARIQQKQHQYQLHLREMESRFIELIILTDSFASSLMDYKPGLSDFINATGALLFECGNGDPDAVSWKCSGLTPPVEKIPELIRWLSTQMTGPVFSTNELPNVYPAAAEYKDAVSGLLAITISREPVSYIVWFRPEKRHTVNWAGDPENSKVRDPESQVLTPRASFELWKEVQRNKSLPWTADEHFMALEVRNVVNRLLLYKNKELHKKNLELEQKVAEKTEALIKSSLELSQFAALAAHDLRIPLRKVASFSEFLADKHAGDLSSESRDYIERIRKAVLKMQSLVDNLLDLSRVTQKAASYSLVDLRELILSIKIDLKDLLDSTHGAIQIGETITVSCNRAQLYQIAFNLVENALKFHKKDIPPVVQVSSRFVNDSCFEISVADNGIGFDERELGNILETFERLPSMGEYEGVGIGLGIVKKIVDHLGGSVEAESEIGRGSIFTVKIPLHNRL